MPEGTFDAGLPPQQGSVDPFLGGTVPEHERSIVNVEGPVQTEVAAHVEQVVGAARNGIALDLASVDFSTAFRAPDASHVENEPTVSARLEVRGLPERFSQAFIIASTVDGEQARIISQSCAVLNERLTLCGEPVFRVGADNNGEVSGAVYTLAQLLEANAVVGINWNTQGEPAGFVELGRTFQIAGTDVSVEMAAGSFDSDEYGRLSLKWARDNGIDVSMQVFIPENGEAQPSITVSRRF